jgi:Xaa-Pro aminopeptidase
VSGSVRLTAMSLPNGTFERLETERSISSNGVNGAQGQALWDSIGHGLGLKLGEPPIIIEPKDKTVIKKNMIFTIKINKIVPKF